MRKTTIKKERSKLDAMKIKIITTALSVSAFIAGACVTANNLTCDDITHRCPDGTTSPDGTSYQDGTCTSSSTKELNIDVGSGSGYDTKSSSGQCNYTCTYVDSHGDKINCGSFTNSWNGTKPGSNKCPAGSGSGTGT